jgi:putative peptidoglycan lipid II flippase
LASFLVQGSIAYLSYAWLILMFPLGVFAMAVSTAIFPTLATQSATGQRDEQRATFVFGLRLILFLTVPAAVGLIVLGKPLVALLLERGAFDARATEATAFALAFMAIGLPGHALIEIVNRAFYAERDTVTPVKVGAAGAALDLLLASVLMRTPLSFGGLALAAAIWALFEAAVLMIILQRRTGLVPPGELAGFGWRISLSAATMGIVAVGLQRALSSIVHPSAWAQTAVLFAVGLTAVFVYLALARALGVDDARRAAGLLRPRVHPG